MNKNSETNKDQMAIKYSIYRPAGNDTAFVQGFEYTQEQRKMINDEIMKKHPNVEQVGFIDVNAEKHELQMAGGEFCGNATRSAAYVYLNGKQGEFHMIVNKKDQILAGVTSNHQAWCEIPLYYGSDMVRCVETGIYIVKMNGMVTVVVKKEVAKEYLFDKDEKRLKQLGLDFINKYNLENNEAVGVMFCEEDSGMLKINPIVWVNAINTLFYETACGSGTTAVCMVEAFTKSERQMIDVKQPSGLIITGKISYENGQITRAFISGNVETDGKTYTLILDGESIPKRRIRKINQDKIGDFEKLYKVFREPPYNENWTDEMIRNEFYDLLKDGEIYGYYIGEECVGLITFRDYRIEDNEPVTYDKRLKVAYLADMTVLKEYRNQGIGTSLVEYALNILKTKNYDRVYMKTLEVGKSMSYGIVVKLGFQLLDATSEDVRERTTISRTKIDKKIYLDIML